MYLRGLDRVFRRAFPRRPLVRGAFAASLLFALAASAGCRPFGTPSADEILRRADEWSNATRRPTRLELRGEIDVIGNAVPVRMYFEAPDHVRYEFENRYGTPFVVATNGSSAWTYKDREMSDCSREEAEQLRSIAVAMFRDSGPAPSDAELLRTEYVHGSEAYVVRFTDPDGDVQTYWIDSTAFCPVRQTTHAKPPDGEADTDKAPDVDVMIAGYLEFEGVAVPGTLVYQLPASAVKSLTLVGGTTAVSFRPEFFENVKDGDFAHSGWGDL